MPQEHLVDRVRAVARIDLAPSHSRPAAARTAVATAVSVIGSLLADAVLVKLGTSLFPSTRGFAHFRFSDYAALTVIGVTAAGAAWGVVTRVTSAPRWLFVRLAFLVTLALWLPDGWLLWRGEPPKAVAVLMVMHLAIALVTYTVLVHVAPIGSADAAVNEEELHEVAAAPEPDMPEDSPETAGLLPADGAVAVPAGEAVAVPADGAVAVPAGEPKEAHLLWILMACATGLEFLLGIAGLVVVPLGRPSGWVALPGGASLPCSRGRGGGARCRRAVTAEARRPRGAPGAHRRFLRRRRPGPRSARRRLGRLSRRQAGGDGAHARRRDGGRLRLPDPGGRLKGERRRRILVGYRRPSCSASWRNSSGTRLSGERTTAA